MAGEFIPDAAPGQFIPDAPVRSALGEIGNQFKAGALADVPDLVGKGLQYTGKQGDYLHDIGSKVRAYGEEQARRPDLQPDTENHNGVTNFLAAGARTVPAAAAPLLAGAGAAALGPEAGVGALIAGGAGALAGALPFAAAGGQETYEKALAAGKTNDEAVAAGRQNALAQAAIMTAAGAVTGGAARIGGGITGKLLGKEAATGSEAAENFLNPSFAKNAALGAGESVAANTGMGVGGAAAQAGIESAHGIGDKSPGDAAKEALMPSLAGALAFTPLALLGAHKTGVERGAIKAKLTDVDASPQARMDAAAQVIEAIKKADPEAAQMFAINADRAIAQKRPIGLDGSWTDGPHPSLFQELLPPPKVYAQGEGVPANPDADARMAELVAKNDKLQADRDAVERGPQRLALPAPEDGAPNMANNIPIPMGEGSGPFDLTKQHASNNATEANDAMWAARHAEEERLNQLAANGPLSSAAAAGIRSGAHEDAQAKRAAEIPEGEAAEGPTDAQSTVGQSNIAAFTRKTEPLTLAAAQERAKTVNGAEHEYRVVPHPKGDYAVVPKDILSQAQQDQHAGLQSRGQEAPPTPRMPFDTPEAAQSTAARMTADSGIEHEVVPHELAREKYQVRPKAEEPVSAVAETPPAAEKPAEAEAPVVSDSIKEPVQEQKVTAPDAPTADIKVEGAGKHKDGTDWSTSYGTVKRTDGTFSLTRTMKDADGTVVQHLGVDGTWQKGLPGKTAVFGGEQLSGPEHFSTEEHALAAARDDVKDMSGEEQAHHSQSQTRDGDGRFFEPLEKPKYLGADLKGGLETSKDAGTVPEMKGLTGEPERGIVNMYGAEPLSPRHEHVIAAAVHDLVHNLGMPASYLKGLSAFHIHKEAGTGVYYVNAKSIGMKRQLLDSIHGGDKAWAQTLRGLVAHEIMHHLDAQPRKGAYDGGQKFASSTSHEFSIDTDEKGRRTPTGPVIKEAWELMRNGPKELSELLRYPLAEMYLHGPDEDHTALLQEETFAQLGRLYYTNPDALKRHAPQSHALFQRIHDATKSSGRTADAQRAVREALREVDSEGRPTGADAQPRAGQASAGGLGFRETGRRVEQDGERPAAGEGRSLDAGDAGERVRGSDLAGDAQRDGDAARDAPSLTDLPGHSPGHHQVARDAAAEYMRASGLPYNPPTKYVKVDPAYAKRVAAAYEAMKHDPSDPAVKASYDAMIKETMAQWEAIKKTGLKVDFASDANPYPYKVPSEVIRDVRDNNHITVFPTDSGFGGSESKLDVSKNPLLAPTGETISGHPALANDIFRIVHDYFGHIKEGVGFRADGEENAWRAHSAMYSELARPAMTSETRGQNSWVNYGPHGEKNRGASELGTEYAEQKTGLLPSEFVNDSRDARAAKSGSKLDEAVPELKAHSKGLLPEERAKLDKRTAKTFVDLMHSLPDAKEMAAVAFAGKAKRGWYRHSAEAMSHVFGPDAPRFTALLAAMSPQTSVEKNLSNALRTWKGWVEAGRPTSRSEIIRIMGENVEGNKLTDSVLPAWINNSVRALTHENPEHLTISGPKVNSFFRNLMGHTNEVTNDAWMANYAAVDQKIFAGSLNKAGTDPGKTPGYLAMSARTREAAAKISKLTGEEWTPAEVQETVWSWARTLYNMASVDRSARDILNDKALTDELINSTPDFRTLLNEGSNSETLRAAGYGDKLDGLSGIGRGDAVAAEGSGAEGKAGPFTGEAQDRLLQRAAGRLDALRTTRNEAEALTASINDEDGNPHFAKTGTPFDAPEATFAANGAVNTPPRAARPIDEKNKPAWVKKLDPEMQETLRKAGVWTSKQSLKERWTEAKHEMGLKILQGTVDQFRPVLEKLGEYPYKLLRMASSSDAGLEASLHNGQLEVNSVGALQVKKGTKGLLEILKPLQGETDRFMSWIAGKRAEGLKKEDREHLFGDADIAALKGLNGRLHDADDFAGGESRAMVYARVLRDYNEFSKSIIDIAEKSGIIDGEKRQLWEKQFYVPFYREAEDGAQKVNPGNLSGMVNQYAFKKLKGGDGVLHDLLANTMQNWGHLLNASLKNRAAVETLEKAQELGIAREVNPNIEKGSVYVLKDGAQKHYVVDDQLVLDAVSSLEQSPLRGPVMKALSTFKHALTVGTTASPVFRIRHTIREQITALAANPTGYNFVKNWVDGFKYSSRDNPQYGNMLAGGSFFRMGQSLEGNRAAYVKHLVEKGIDETTVLDTPEKVKSALAGAWEWWKETGERSDSITRANLYRQTYAAMIERGKSPDQAHFEASYVARDAMDYSLHGTWAAIRMITQVVPFMNARAQGLYKLGRGLQEDPKRFAAVVGGVTLATVALSLAYRNDKDMQSREEWDRDNNWAFKVGDKMFRVPKPFEIGALGTVVDRALEVAMSGFSPEERERFAKNLIPIVGSQLAMNPIPQAIFPALELWANKDVFTGRSIESMRDEKLQTSERIGPSTSATAIALGKAGVLSPEQIDFLSNAYLGWVGAHAVATADLALRPGMGLPSKPSARIDDYFLVGDFVKSLPPDQSRFTEEFYDHLKTVQQAFGTMQNFKKTGQSAKATEFSASNKQDITLHPLYIARQRQLSMINQRIRFVQAQSTGGDEKRAQLTQLFQQRNMITRAAEEARAGRL